MMILDVYKKIDVCKTKTYMHVFLSFPNACWFMFQNLTPYNMPRNDNILRYGQTMDVLECGTTNSQYKLNNKAK